MPQRIAVAALIVSVLAGARPARAEGFITPFIGFNFGGDSANCLSLTNCDQKRTNFGVSLGTLSGVGFEEDISYAKDFFGAAPGTDSSVFSAMSNLLIVVPAGPVRPYLLGGVGLIKAHVSTNLSTIASFDNNTFGYDLGGGLHIIFGHIGARGDVRRFKTLQDIPLFTNQPLTFWRGSVGVTFAF